MKNIAFFDFDKTLTNTDTFILFSLFSLGKKKLFFALLLEAPFLMAWKLKIYSNSLMKERLFSRLFKGRSRKWFEQKGEEFISEIERHINNKGIKYLLDHIKSKDETCIVSASIDSWIKPWAKKMGITNVIATKVEYSNEILTGGFLTPNCYGKEKVRRIINEYGDLSYRCSFAYSDSKSDLPMLELADKGRII